MRGGTAPLAAWAVVNASSSDVISGGHLAGLTQPSNRAELQALIAAVSWVATFQCNAQIWCDSKNTVQVATALQQGDHRCLRGTPDNHDLLAALAEQIQHTEPRQLSIHWIPSHLDLVQCADGFEEWICTWNNIADSIAFSFNESREPSLERILQMQTQWCNSWTHATRTMQTFYLAVADSIQHESEPQLPELQGGHEPRLDWAAHVGHHSLAGLLGFRLPALALVSALLNLQRSWLLNWRSGMTLHANLSPSV